MGAEQLKKEISTYAKKIGIDQVGFASADPFFELKERLYRHREAGYESGFEEQDIEKRTHPEKNMSSVRSIIAIALAYPSKLKNAPRSKKGVYRGVMARVSWGKDYHKVLQKKISRLESFIKEKVPDAECQSMVDTGALSDRAVAERAGIGWSGKNTSLISPKLGSWIYLGEMLTSVYLPPDHPVEDSCGECRICVDACPTGALVQGGQLNSQRCIAFVTQRKDFIEEEFKEKIGNRIYGCDTCQQVCPKNKGVHFDHHPEFQPDPETVKPLLKPLLTIGKKDFKSRFGASSGAWRGKKPLQRNAVIALGNFRDVSAVSDLIHVLKKDVRPVMRESAAWSLSKIGGEEAREALVKAKAEESDSKVLSEINKGLSVLKKA